MMRYSKIWMPVVFVIATDWKLRTAVRAELRERGIDARPEHLAGAASCAS